MGGYAFWHYKEPCPNCGGTVKGSAFSGDHYDDPSSSVYCDNEKCGATFIRDTWETFCKEKHGKKFYIMDYSTR